MTLGTLSSPLSLFSSFVLFGRLFLPGALNRDSAFPHAVPLILVYMAPLLSFGLGPQERHSGRQEHYDHLRGLMGPTGLSSVVVGLQW